MVGRESADATHHTAGLVPRLSYHHFLMLLSAIAIILLSRESPISTGPGQVSSAIAHAIHNVSQTGNGTTLEVRAGYKGILLANLIKAEKSSVSNGNTSTETIPDPLNLIMIANEFKDKIVFDGLIYIVVGLIFICFILLSTFPGWHEEVDENGSEREVKPFPSELVLSICFLAMGAGFGFGLISVLWQHINSSSTATMAETLTYGTVSGHVGGAAMALGWISTGLSAVVFIGLLVIKLSISILASLTADE
ncbi:hypothetical protein N7522_013396 [Penicillium canescens]|nr:hypothetical protein N7522_013396 [Penicillium canescens]